MRVLPAACCLLPAAAPASGLVMRSRPNRLLRVQLQVQQQPALLPPSALPFAVPVAPLECEGESALDYFYLPLNL